MVRGHAQARPLNRRSVNLILRKRARVAGLQRFMPHDLRRTFISGLLDAGADLPTVSLLAGHRNFTTTALYDRRGERAKRAAIGLLAVPYKPPPAGPPSGIPAGRG